VVERRVEEGLRPGGWYQSRRPIQSGIQWKKLST